MASSDSFYWLGLQFIVVLFAGIAALYLMSSIFKDPQMLLLFRLLGLGFVLFVLVIFALKVPKKASEYARSKNEEAFLDKASARVAGRYIELKYNEEKQKKQEKKFEDLYDVGEK